MSSFWSRLIPRAFRRSISTTKPTGKGKVTLGDPIEHATGIEKRELLAIMAGNEDPFDLKRIKRGPGTRAQPTEIPSAFDSRIIGCICEEASVSIVWMWLHKGEPKRCECGYWFNLVHKAPL
ncbi:cytochrome c oxidase subunit 5B, mitochondrial-like [Anthonomus grandis grandis]|uniref:cytochrome c oxidase subunit 5B, mitochondrial-like n=1 Tax=Anthonomus grandis grandis TaxID=2921223 RepID=UPI00216677CD|nr:cytochrome c oxidase subunit 5B, mitochondrial-like [Anthonomus grandis grandis]